jgi:RHS repeat-associated protein
MSKCHYIILFFWFFTVPELTNAQGECDYTQILDYDLSEIANGSLVKFDYEPFGVISGIPVDWKVNGSYVQGILPDPNTGQWGYVLELSEIDGFIGNFYSVEAFFPDCPTQTKKFLVKRYAEIEIYGDGVDGMPICTSSARQFAFTSQHRVSPGTSTEFQWFKNGVYAGSGQTVNITSDQSFTIKVEMSMNGPGNKVFDEVSISVAVPSSSNTAVEMNKIETVSIENPGIVALENLESLSHANKDHVISYLDGFGRPIETILHGNSPTHKDIVTYYEYNEIGLEQYKYLPYVKITGDGEFDNYYTVNNKRVNCNQKITYNGSLPMIAIDSKPYAETVYEQSPHARSLKQGSPGLAWQPNHTSVGTEHVVTREYRFNYDYEVVRWFFTYPTEENSPTAINAFGKIDTSYPTRNYAAAQLYRNLTRDEEQREVIEYVDREGRTILKRVQAANSPDSYSDIRSASTYYIYDDFGNLVCVLPPEATRRITQTSPASEFFGLSDAQKNDFLKRWAFRYRYDGRQRMAMKQVPGAEPVYLVYDNRDRLVMTQDGNQRLTNQWTFTKYDALNRPVLTGLYTHGSAANQNQMQVLIDNYYASLANNDGAWYETYIGNSPGNVHGYSNNSWPATDPSQYLTATYYDRYDFKALYGSGYDYQSDNLTASLNGISYTQPATANGSVRSLATGTKVKLLDGSNTWLKALTYYDTKYRPIQTIADNMKGGTDRTSTLFDFVGKVVASKATHQVAGKPAQTVSRSFDYDHAGRLLNTWHQVNNQPRVLLSSLQYNELGQLIDKRLHCTSCLPVQPDPLIGQPGTTYNSTIERSQYNPQEKNLVAQNQIRLLPGFTVSAGNTLIARTGLDQAGATANFQQQVAQGAAQSIDYRYNIRGWLTSINNAQLANDGNATNNDTNDYFGMELGYNEAIGTGNSSLYNGNISATKWSNNMGLGTVKQHGYNYAYDAINRLTGSTFKQQAGTWGALGNGGLNEAGLSYDLNGNILALTRNDRRGSGTMDALAYAYLGNQLLKVTDSGDKAAGFKDGSNLGNDHAYDANGNMAVDNNKDVASITYNYLNLPAQVTKNTGEQVRYAYDAMGRKLRQDVFLANGTLKKRTDYVGEYFYENDTLKFINHEEGRVVMQGGTPEYQYHLKDHLGNVRTTFTTKQETEAPVATLETASTTTERANFLKYDDVRKVNSPLFDHTAASTTQYAVRLTGTPQETYGLARSISVVPGDKLSTEVYAKYVDLSQPDVTTALRDFIGLIVAGSAGAGVVVDGGTYGSSGAATIPHGSLLNKANETGNAPKAYLNWLVFDKNFMFISSKSGYRRLTDAAKENGTLAPEGVLHEKLESPEILITEPGYVYIYLSNEEPGKEVYFDDFSVTHTKSPIVASDDYYPGGAPYNSFTRENSLINKYKYQGKEWQTDLGLELYDFGRPYDPWLLHTITQDAHAENYYSWSPYSWSFDNPTRFVDPTGMDPEDPISIGALLNKAVEAASTIVDFFFGGGNDGSAESAAAMGEAHNTMQAVGVEAQNMKSENNGNGPGDGDIPKREPFGNWEYFFFGGIEDGVLYRKDGTPVGKVQIGYGVDAGRAKIGKLLVQQNGIWKWAINGRVASQETLKSFGLIKPSLTPSVGNQVIPQFLEKAEGELMRKQNPGFWNRVMDFFYHSSQFFGN